MRLWDRLSSMKNSKEHEVIEIILNIFFAVNLDKQT